ncbi:MAG: response regulator [Clostridia bacterium]|nr:response regulator [Clostridia bacterium]
MYRVLIVDDELPALRFVQSIIEKFSLDFQIAGTCTSGEAAIEFLQKEPVDLVITDISMHGITGIKLAKHIRATQPAIHTLIISGYPMKLSSTVV